LDAANKAVTDAQAKAAAAVAPADILTSELALRKAVLERYQLELQMVAQVQAAIQTILTAATTMVQMVTAAAQLDIQGGGGFGTITGLLASLQDTAETASTTAARLWAVDQALKAIIAVLPTAIAQFGSMQHGADWIASGIQTAAQLRAGGPSQITGGVLNAASPFLAAQQGAIDQATGATKLGLLQQQAAQFAALAQAAIAGINQWAQQAIAGAQAAAQTALDALAKERDAKLKAIDLQIDALGKEKQAALD